MLSDEIKSGLDVAFNEATLLGVEVSESRQVAAITLALLTLPSNREPAPEDSQVSVILDGVSRVAVSLRDGNWHDRSAATQPVLLDSLPDVVRTFQGQPVYGGEFFDQEENFRQWSDRLSLDATLHPSAADHSLTLFQEGVGRHLDIRLWFSNLRITDAEGQPLNLKQVIAGGQRWWKAMYGGDPRTKGSGTSRLKEGANGDN